MLSAGSPLMHKFKYQLRGNGLVSSSKVSSYLGPQFGSCGSSTVSDNSHQPWCEDIVSWMWKFFLCFSFLSVLPLSIIWSELTACRAVHSVGAGSSHWEVSIKQDRGSLFCLILKVRMLRCFFLLFFAGDFEIPHFFGSSRPFIFLPLRLPFLQVFNVHVINLPLLLTPHAWRPTNPRISLYLSKSTISFIIQG